MKCLNCKRLEEEIVELRQTKSKKTGNQLLNRKILNYIKENKCSLEEAIEAIRGE